MSGNPKGSGEPKPRNTAGKAPGARGNRKPPRGYNGGKGNAGRSPGAKPGSPKPPRGEKLT